MQRDLLAVHAGVVEGEVQTPERVDRSFHQCLDVGRPAHVGRLEDGLPSGLPDRRNDDLAFSGARFPIASAAPALAIASDVALPIPDPRPSPPPPCVQVG